MEEASLCGVVSSKVVTVCDCLYRWLFEVFMALSSSAKILRRILGFHLYWFLVQLRGHLPALVGINRRDPSMQHIPRSPYLKRVRSGWYSLFEYFFNKLWCGGANFRPIPHCYTFRIPRKVTFVKPSTSRLYGHEILPIEEQVEIMRREERRLRE